MAKLSLSLSLVCIKLKTGLRYFSIFLVRCSGKIIRHSGGERAVHPAQALLEPRLEVLHLARPATGVAEAVAAIPQYNLDSALTSANYNLGIDAATGEEGLTQLCMASREGESKWALAFLDDGPVWDITDPQGDEKELHHGEWPGCAGCPHPRVH